MNSERDKKRMNVDGDRISSLPDDLIAKILSFNGTKGAVETSTLSSRWRFIWTKIPYLNFSSEDFSTLPKFHNFFTRVLASCNNQVEMSLNLHGKVNSEFVRKILNQACSHNLQQLTFTFLDEKNIECPLSLFSSQSLKHLTLIGAFASDLIPTSMWELPALTSLHLERIRLYDDSKHEYVGLFSNCTNLKSLTIIECYIMGNDSFTICHPQLSNITFKYRISSVNAINVVAPQLKNLTINNYAGNFRISKPDELTSLLYKNRTLKLSIDVDSLPSLEKLDLFMSNTRDIDAREVVDLLQKFNRVKFLTLNLEVMEFLSSAVRDAELAQNLMVELRVLIDLEKHEEDKRQQQGTKMPLDMWKSESQVNSYCEDLIEEIKRGETKTNEIESLVLRIKDLLIKLPTSNKAVLQPRFSSLCAEADTVICKIVNCMNTKSAPNLMAKLRVLLKRKKAPMQKHKEDERQQSCTDMQLDMQQKQSQVNSYWDGLYKDIIQGKQRLRKLYRSWEKIKCFFD